ncbi:MAG TPA: winged helix-turn-helix domain-containing protein [Herpetosiphonaceae bacterium]
MQRPKLTSDRAETIINTLRDNPGVTMTLSEISDETGLPADELAAHLEELLSHGLILNEKTGDGLDTYRFPDEYQRGSTP